MSLIGNVDAHDPNRSLVDQHRSNRDRAAERRSAYDRAMPSLDQLRESIEARLAELHSEVASLEKAQAALHGEQRGNETPADATGKSASRVRRRPAGGANNGRATRARAKRPPAVLGAGDLEAILRDADVGLNAATIAKRSDAGYNQVLDLLRTLERDGQVRRTGARRTTLWHLISDEERIAKRAAELEARMAKPAG